MSSDEMESAMKVSREQMAENRLRILEAASRLFRAHGFEAVTVSQVMAAAGLTHGGFYGHFASKDDLIAQTLAHVLAPGSGIEPDLAGYATAYLERSHRDDMAGGCPVAALASESARKGGAARSAMTAGLQRQIDRFTATAPGRDQAEKRRAAIGSWAALVGAVVLARMSEDPALSDEVLAETRAWLGAKAV
jgi:TetR/AcrR family transcriptional regulator, transcriptional repressor for nem operon